MTKRSERSRWQGFWVFCLALALVVLVATAFTLEKLNTYLVDMEKKALAEAAARPELVLDAYTSQLDSAYVMARLDSLYAMVDSRVQSREDCQAILENILAEGLGYRLDLPKKDSERYLIYTNALEDGKHRQVGEFTITVQGQDSYGNNLWGLESEWFNMDYLLRPGFSLTVPSDLTVLVNGKPLDESCVTQSGIPYESLENFPADVALPTKTTYTLGITLGDVALALQDAHGNTLPINTATDWSASVEALLQPGFAITVPSDHTVWVNGQQLGEEAIAKKDVPFEGLEHLSQLAQLPTKTIYTLGSTLGPVAVEIRDPQGKVVTIDENTDWNRFIDNCPEDVRTQATQLTDRFLKDYIRFTSTSQNIMDHYYTVIGYMVPKGDLAKRMQLALDGLQWVDPYEDELVALDYNHILLLSDGRLLCDATYTVNMISRKGELEETVNTMFLYRNIDGQWKLEELLPY